MDEFDGWRVIVAVLVPLVVIVVICVGCFMFLRYRKATTNTATGNSTLQGGTGEQQECMYMHITIMMLKFKYLKSH